MAFSIIILPQADRDIQHYRVPVQRVIIDGIRLYLSQDADQETKRKKPLRPNPIASWELRIDIYRVFYHVAQQTVTVVAVGHKEHNRLYIRDVEVAL
jgi:mRNA-degrading endonuclease RelE of RelBE toxin-antitoxin system